MMIEIFPEQIFVDLLDAALIPEALLELAKALLEKGFNRQVESFDLVRDVKHFRLEVMVVPWKEPLS